MIDQASYVCTCVMIEPDRSIIHGEPTVTQEDSNAAISGSSWDRCSGALETPAATFDGATATGVRLSPGPSCRRANVVTSESVTPAPLEVEHDTPDEQGDDGDEDDQQDRHHDLLPERLSSYAAQARIGPPARAVPPMG
jgi:hypothetical protein